LLLIIPPVVLLPPVELPTAIVRVEPDVSRSYVRTRAINDKGWDEDQWDCLEVIIQRESEWKANASNPNSSAYGLFQMLKTPKSTSVKQQTTRGLKYIKNRYGEPCEALKHHDKRGWY
jgi:hypothetical protein